MKRILFYMAIFLVGLCSTALAQNKVVVVPLSSSKAGGTDGQFQYNDAGKNAGAEVYYDKDTGRVGIGTSGPSEEMHIVDGDTPTVRLDQDGTDGWAPQVWNVAGNESNFFVQDISHGSSLPFRIQPGAPSNSIFIANTGNVGIGTSSPAGKLDVDGTIYQRGGVLHADYVFDSKYQLESIEEHSCYMWKNKHLKAVPKAQYDKNGLEIVEMGSHRKGMLEELEKAHIYIDQLNTQIAELRALVCQDHPRAEACH